MPEDKSKEKNPIRKNITETKKRVRRLMSNAAKASVFNFFPKKAKKGMISAKNESKKVTPKEKLSEKPTNMNINTKTPYTPTEKP